MSKIPRARWPRWVRWTLWGAPSRQVAVACEWISGAIAATSLVLGFGRPVYWCGTILFLGAFLYHFAIRWVDRHTDW